MTEERAEYEVDSPEARVRVELDELIDKMVKLRAFMYSDRYRKISVSHQCLLRKQMLEMDGYAETLHKRIEIFEDERAQRDRASLAERLEAQGFEPHGKPLLIG